MNYTENFCLIGKIKGLAEQSRLARKCIAEAAKAKKESAVWDFVSTKRCIGSDARHHLLAYGFVKGTPYRMMESKCRDDNRPSARIIRLILAVNTWPSILDYKYPVEKIEAWLKDETHQPVVQPKREKLPYIKKDTK